MFTTEDKEYLNNSDYSMPLEKFTDNSYYRSNNGKNGTVTQAYPFSNEKLHNVFKHLRNIKSRCLTVGSSGDQLLYCLYYGCKDVTLIDANLYSKYWINYKMAAIKNLSFDVFKEYFLNALDSNEKNPFNYEIYSKIFHDLPDDSKEFWGSIFLEEYTPQEIFANIINRRDINIDRVFSIFYHDVNAYNKLQQIIKNNNYKLEFINENFPNFYSAIEGKFDVILLSNIKKYVGDATFKQNVDALYKYNLNKGGIIQLHYEYRNILGKKSTRLTSLFPQKNILGYKFKDCHFAYLMTKPRFIFEQEEEKTL